MLDKDAIVTIRHFDIRKTWAPQNQSLVSRIAILLMLAVTLTTVVLVAGIDGYVTKQFNVIHEDFIVKRTEEVKQILDREGNLLLRSIELAATDSNLVHSVHYHVNLRGEAKALREEVERMVRTFGLGVLEIRTTEGIPIVAHDRGDMRLKVTDTSPTEGAKVRMIWHDGNIWALAISPLTLAPGSYAVMIAGRPLGPLISTVMASPVKAATASEGHDTEAPDETIRIAIEDMNGNPTSILINAPNPVRVALAKTKNLVIGTLAIGSVLLLLVITIFLRVELRPIATLTTAVEEFGRGLNPKFLNLGGAREISSLVQAFNRMVTDIQRLRDIEQKMYHERQLATIGKLAAKVAHDINNPLTVIASITRLLLHGNTTDRRLSEDLATILKSCERCTDISVNLLRFSRPLKLNQKPFELGTLCREAIEHSCRRLTAMTITLRAYPEPVMVEGDEFQLGRVLDNLINNAFQASAGSEVVLEYGITQGRAYFAVIDQGKGFTTEAINHLFEPFFTTKPDGSGLGLASSLAVISAHGGELTVTAADKGHVTAWLPLL